MVIGLPPLEFTDCVSDSPYFRKNLHDHEKELENTSQQIKRLIKELKDLLTAARNLSRAQRTLSSSLQNFSFECIGTTQTDDELVISKSLGEFGRLIALIEDERDRMMDRMSEQIITPLENFRKGHIGGVKEGKKKFEKQTAKFCHSQERYLNLSTKKQDTFLQEADATLEMERRHFIQASLEYVFLLQEVQERKKFEFVEPLLSFMFGWLTFYHQGHEVAEDFKPFMRELQLRIQKTRENFISTRDKTESLMKKTLETRQTKSLDAGSSSKICPREGYLFLMEKKAFGAAWTKQYCTYQKVTKEFSMIPYNQMAGKFNTGEKMTLASCVRRMSDSIEKRFCFDLTSVDKPGVTYTLQALSEEDRKQWMDVMDGKEPMYSVPHQVKVSKAEEKGLDEVGFMFVTKCIEVLESRGLEEQGLYRVVGVNSKVNKLFAMGLDQKKLEKLSLEDPCEWESKTITSALKMYLRNLQEPIMTFKYHNNFISAAKQETQLQRLNEVHSLLHKIPQQNFNMLDILIRHLTNVVSLSDKNLMTTSNLGVCFGPTLLRPEEETVAAIMDIKFCNIVVEILIENYAKIFKTQPVQNLPEQGPLEQNAYPQPVPRQKYQNIVPVTHAVIKSYYDGPMSVNYNSSLVSVNSNMLPARGAFIGIPPNRGTSIPQNRITTSTSGFSDNNLHGLGSTSHSSIHSNLQQNKQSVFHSNVGNSDPQSTSSSNESVSSVSSHDINIHSNYIGITPQKSKRSRLNTIGSYYTPPYRLPENVSVRTLYACVAENDGELSFEPNQIITNVKQSEEPGWLVGTLNGKTGLVPENYVEILPT